MEQPTNAEMAAKLEEALKRIESLEARVKRMEETERQRVTAAARQSGY
jgi:hypothetical protein